jgi:hypothetical protein
MTTIVILMIITALLARTVAQEELFREVRETATLWGMSKNIFGRKLAYLITCEFCTAFWIAALFVFLGAASLFGPDTSLFGQALSWLIVVAGAVTLLALFDHLKIKTKLNRLNITLIEKEHLVRLEMMNEQKRAFVEQMAAVNAVNNMAVTRVNQSLMGGDES